MTSQVVRDPMADEAQAAPERLWVKRLKKLSPLAAVGVFVAIGWLLHRNLQTYSIAEIRQEMAIVPRAKLFGALALTALNYFCLTICDRLAFRVAGVSLPAPKIAAASVISYAASYNFGALLGGASMRYRLYSLWGITAADILKIAAILALATWIGLLSVASVAFLTASAPAHGHTAIAAATLRLAGAIMAGLVLAYLSLTLIRRQPIRLGNVDLRLPSFRMALGQAVASSTEISLAAGALWVLLPNELHVPFPVLLAGYMLAVFATILSQTPGGLGVFELVVLSYVVPDKSPAAVGAVVLYRFVYYLTPLTVAAIGYIVAEWRTGNARLRQAAAGASRWIGPIVPRLLAMLVFLCGIVLLFSGAVPAVPERLEPLARWLPVHITETGHLVGSIVGTMLLVLSHGLSRRFDSAWLASVGLVIVGIVASLVKGFDWEEASVLTVVLILLAISRSEFYRQGALLHSRLSPRWWTAIALGVAAAIWLGTFAYKEVGYSRDLW